MTTRGDSVSSSSPSQAATTAAGSTSSNSVARKNLEARLQQLTRTFNSQPWAPYQPGKATDRNQKVKYELSLEIARVRKQLEELQ